MQVHHASSRIMPRLCSSSKDRSPCSSSRLRLSCIPVRARMLICSLLSSSILRRFFSHIVVRTSRAVLCLFLFIISFSDRTFFFAIPRMPPDILLIHIPPSLILRLLCTTTTTTYIFPSCDYLYPCIPPIRPIHFTSKISRLSFSFNIHHRRSTINSILFGSFFIIIFLFEPTHFISLPFIINRYLPTLHSPHIRSNQNIYNSSLVVFRIPYPLPPRVLSKF